MQVGYAEGIIYSVRVHILVQVLAQVFKCMVLRKIGNRAKVDEHCHINDYKYIPVFVNISMYRKVYTRKIVIRVYW